MLTAALAAALAILLWPGCWSGPDPLRLAARGPSRGSRWVSRVIQLARRPVARTPDDAWVADFAEVVAVGLDAGLDLPAATLASARSPAVLARAPWLVSRLQASVESGRGVTAVLEGAPHLRHGERHDLALLLAAWRLAEEVGAAAAAVTSVAAASVRERRSAAERTAVVVAGPRASMLLLSALPLAGPAAAVLIGLPPGRLYDSPASRLLAVSGLLLTATGWWWSRRLLRRARRPGRTDGATT